SAARSSSAALFNEPPLRSQPSHRRPRRSRLMATHVYANGNEIASKSASGSSRHAFPDVCHTAPPTASGPFPPGVPIPYPNTCHAADITNGSRTVFILGKEIALENHSYFSVSEGDDD